MHIRKLCAYICAINNNKTMTHTIEVTKQFQVIVDIYNDCVITTTKYLDTTRKSSFESIEDLINNTSIPAVANFFKNK